MKLLLSNDDGIEAPGLVALAQALEKDYEFLVVAPATEKSACGHSISIGQELVIEERKKGWFAVYGTPADAIKLALSEIEDFRPDLLISGINPGPNTGVSVYYSGTISAAREGLINRIPSMAVSLGSKTPASFATAASFVLALIKGYEKNAFPQDVLLNINIPDLSESEIRGVKVARQASSRFVEEFIKVNASGHKRVYTLAGEIEIFDADGTTDEEVLNDGFISITPLKLDLTDYQAMSVLEQWFKERTFTWQKQKRT